MPTPTSMRPRLALAATLLGAVVLSGCGGSDEEPPVATAYELVAAFGEPGGDDRALTDPVAIAANRDRNVFVVDRGRGRIQAFTDEGEFLRAFGGRGGRALQDPGGLAIDLSRNVYVADTGADRVQVFDVDGRPAGLIGAGRLSSPADVGLGGDDLVLAADTGNDRIAVFDAEGELVDEWGEELLDAPDGIAVDSSDRVWVTDRSGARVQRFDLRGEPEGEVNATEGVRLGLPAIDDVDNLLLPEPRAGRVAVHNLEGAFLTAFGNRGDEPLARPVAATVDGSGFVYVIDAERRRIVKFAPPTG